MNISFNKLFLLLAFPLFLSIGCSVTLNPEDHKNVPEAERDGIARSAVKTFYSYEPQDVLTGKYGVKRIGIVGSTFYTQNPDLKNLALYFYLMNDEAQIRVKNELEGYKFEVVPLQRFIRNPAFQRFGPLVPQRSLGMTEIYAKNARKFIDMQGDEGLQKNEPALKQLMKDFNLDAVLVLENAYDIKEVDPSIVQRYNVSGQIFQLEMNTQFALYVPGSKVIQSLEELYDGYIATFPYEDKNSRLAWFTQSKGPIFMATSVAKTPREQQIVQQAILNGTKQYMDDTYNLVIEMIGRIISLDIPEKE